MLFVLNRYATLALSLALTVEALSRAAVSNGHQSATSAAAADDKVSTDCCVLVTVRLMSPEIQ